MAAAKRKQEGGGGEVEMSFEAAMGRLEHIVEEMEGAELPLEDILRRYEEGTRLRVFCERKLREAEERVKKIRPGPGGEPVEEPFEEGAESAEEKGAAEGSGDENLLL